MASSGGMVQWYFNDGANWTPYDVNSNTSIENTYQTGTKELCIKTYSHTYTVDLLNKKQINISTGTKRDIKRSEIGTDTMSLPVRLPLVPHGASIMPQIPATYLQPASFTYHMPLPVPIATIPATSDLSFSRPISAPRKSGTKSSPTPKPPPSHDDTISAPPIMPRKKYKHEPNKFPRAIGTYDTFFHNYTEIKNGEKVPKDEMCPICLTLLLEPADVDIPKKSRSSSMPLDVVCALKKCSHIFHMVCIGTMLDSTPNMKVNELSISCPICQTIHGVKTGDQPVNGTMLVTREGSSVPGYEGYGTIKIRYGFHHGVSETGTKYNAAGFPRVCYVPDCPEGKTVLELLNLAWKRRLIFTIGTSVTTGCPNCVVWNNIHHKTEPHSNTSGHGFPDPNFLKNIKMELAVQGVTEEELK
ncbi:E3 ubiquitin-protein ligase DTX2 [Oopsacas minuta]|uniref:E3 ubiquitin-protein ligase n=1 Tax=Oopsacas minuta TaxID=111878 RepID=A0AAV7JLF3_9METZ|nr:E3 ubiquitin-protein ligase DTX2 [Oopsacas minuta]